MLKIESYIDELASKFPNLWDEQKIDTMKALARMGYSEGYSQHKAEMIEKINTYFLKS